MPGRPRWYICGILCAVALLAAAGPASARPFAPAFADSVYAAAESLIWSGHPDSALVLLAPVVAAAGAAGAAESALVGSLHQAAAFAMSGRVREAEQTARAAADLAVQLDKLGHGRMAQRWLGYALLGQGRSADAQGAYERLLADATAAGDLREEAYARTGLAYLALGRGETAAARADYELAAPLFHTTGETAMEFDALIGLARTLGRDGRYAEMCRIYERILVEGEAAGMGRAVGFALNNLGTYEYQTGDPGRAVLYWQRALAGKQLSGDLLSSVTPTVNLALARMELGDFDEAAADLAALLDRCRAGGYRLQEAKVLTQLAAVDQARGNRRGALATWRLLMAMDDAGQEMRVDAALLIARTYAADGEAARTAAFCDTVAAMQSRGATMQQRAELALVTANALADLGRHAEAVPLTLQAADGMRDAGFRLTEMSALVQAAGSELALGRPDSALVRLQRARLRWQDLRSVPRDPQWREQRGSLGSAIHLDLAALLLEHPADTPPAERTRTAFDTLQGYKARTLLERMLGPDGTPREAAADEPPVTLDILQREVLRPGEVLLDFFVGERHSLVFAVSDTGCRAATLPGGRALQDQLWLFLDLVATPQAAAAHLPAARRLGQELLAPVAAELRTGTTIIIAADGQLNRLPCELLPWDPSGADPTALGARRDVSRVPSATVLASQRGRATPPGNPGVFVLETAGAAAAKALPGTVAEVRSLRRRYRDVVVASPGCTDRDGAWSDGLAGQAVLHVPAHTEVFDQRPWNSRIALGSDQDGVPCWLPCSGILAQPLAVELAVLSGCSSAGGRALSGEGMLGLTGAFLAAGSRAVVASLWDVDDATTAALMQRFYGRLADGATVAAALAAARRDLAGRAATASPCYWAGFVVVGDGDLRVALQKRTPVAAWVAAGGAAAVLLVGGLVFWRRGRGRVISRTGRSLP